MSTHYWPGGEGPREKLVLRGPLALSDAELLAVFLRTGSPGRSVIGLAGALLQRFDGLAGVMAASAAEIQGEPGVGVAKYAQLQAAMELARRTSLAQIRRGDVLSSPEKTRCFLRFHLQGQRREIFSCLFLDSQHAVICCEDLFQGTLDGAAVYPREVVTRALQLGAGAVILAHNHPSGVAEPSQADRCITERLQAALALVDIRVLDHVIVGGGEPYSFAEQGLL
jgi:DNA repair protein RadC